MPHGLCYACALTAVSHECNALGLCSIVLLCLLETCQKLTIACIQHAGRCAHMPARLHQCDLHWGSHSRVTLRNCRVYKQGASRGDMKEISA